MSDELKTEKQPALVVFDSGEALVYGRDASGNIDLSDTIQWPRDWPARITPHFLKQARVPWRQA